MQPIQVIEAASEKMKLIEHYHNHPLDGGHIGQKRLYAKLRSRFEWKNMAKDVAKYIKNCDKCQINKPKRRNKEPLTLTDTPNKPFQTIVIDTIGPFPCAIGQVKYAITMICEFSKYLIIVPIPNKEAKTIARVIVENLILTFGQVKCIKSDLGTEYCNQVMVELASLLDIEHAKSTAYHHETLGTIERSHKTLNEYLRTYIDDNHKDWPKLVKYFSFCFNTTPNTSINNYTPFELVFGRQPISILDNINDRIDNKDLNVNNSVDNYVNNIRNILELTNSRVKKFIECNKIRYKEYYDRSSYPIDINIGDKILLNNEIRTKLDKLYKPNYTVVDIKHDNVVIRDSNNKISTVHKNRLRKM